MQHPSPSLRLPRRMLPAILAMLVLLTAGGCVYRINIQQGNFLDPKAVDQIVPGMARSQVRFLLGTPMVGSAFDSDRWDYVYYVKRGREREPVRRKVTVFFEGDRVARIERPDQTDQVAQSAPRAAEKSGERSH